MIWSLLQQIGFFIFLTLTVYYVKKEKYVNLIVLYFAGLVFASCSYFFITIWTPDKVASLGMIYCIVFKRRNHNTQIPQPLKNILVFITCILFMSSLIGFTSSPKYTYLISPIQRLMLSNFSYFTTSIIIIYGCLMPFNFKNDFFPRYCRVMELAIITGLVHLLFSYIGVEFMPIHRTGLMGDTTSEEVIAEFGGTIISRIYAFAGEPKGLAFCILPYIIISICLLIQNNYIKNKIYHLTFLILGLIVLFQTYSSSALINAIIIIPLLFVLGGIRPSPMLVAIVVIGLISVLFVGMSTDHELSNFVDNINERTFERGQAELANDRQESVIMSYYAQESPIVQFFGWGLGQYTFNVPGQVWGNSILIPVQSGLVLTIADFGFLGIILFVYIVIVVLNLISKSKKLGSPITLAFAMASLSKIIESTMHGNLTTSLMYLMIAYYMFVYETKIKC